MEKTYSNEDITVHWKPSICEHSTLCWKGMINVFNPKERPWVKIDGATTAEIIAQIDKCPSGALSYKYNKAMNIEPVNQEEDGIVEINVAAMGPTRIKGDFVIKDREGNIILEGKKAVSLCSCGHSSNKPFCDGMHKTLPGYVPPVK